MILFAGGVSVCLVGLVLDLLVGWLLVLLVWEFLFAVNC